MKSRLLVAVAYMFAALFVSCSDEGSEGGDGSADYKSAFESAYPDVSDVTWSEEGDYYIASFSGDGVVRSSSVETQVWYDESGVRYLEEDFIDMDDVPTVIKTDFEDRCDDNGGSTTLVSATKGSYKSSVFYKIYAQVEVQGSSTYTNLGTYYYNGDSDFERMDYDEDVETNEIKTTLPDLYAMQYIEKNYSDYCLGVKAERYTDFDQLEDYGANEFAYGVLLYLPASKKVLEIIFIDGSSSDVSVDDDEWGN